MAGARGGDTDRRVSIRYVVGVRRNPSSQSSLHAAAVSNAVDSSLFIATVNGRANLEHILLPSGISAGMANYAGWTALILTREQKEVVSMLMRNVANANAAIIKGTASLFIATESGQAESVV
uniref:Uncharacterized protein n=1 Tax=Globisporangium ultimum (strain ATCC 200006 / CBS 805.95 / DAOM BR144) TaxID=431595 RepID=K3X476_GLOUD